MVRFAPATALSVYQQSLIAALSAAEHIAALPQLPTGLLALNATFYLQSYLPPAVYRAGLAEAQRLASVERHRWRQSPGTPAGSVELEQLLQAGTPRPSLYRWLFEQALATADPLRLLLAQHACEMAEALDDRALGLALRFGLLELPAATPSALASAAVPPVATLLEALSRALLCRRISAAQFIERLLMLHAANRAHALSLDAYSAPLALVAPLIVPLLTEATMQHVPSRLRVTQPCALAQRALGPLPGHASGMAALVVEAGLVEAEILSSGPHLLLLAAVDRVLSNKPLAS